MAPCSSLLLLGAYYYTWYGVGEQWQVFPRPFEPTMGEYRSADDAVMRQVVSARHMRRLLVAIRPATVPCASRHHCARSGDLRFAPRAAAPCVGQGRLHRLLRGAYVCACVCVCVCV